MMMDMMILLRFSLTRLRHEPWKLEWMDSLPDTLQIESAEKLAARILLCGFNSKTMISA